MFILYSVSKKSTFYFGSNNCQFVLEIHEKSFKRIESDKYYWFTVNW